LTDNVKRLVRSRRARLDLIDIWRFVAEDDPNAADRLLETIDAKCSLLRDHPFLGQAREDIRHGFRYLVIGEYLILYRVMEDCVEIVRIVHGKRDLLGLA